MLPLGQIQLRLQRPRGRIVRLFRQRFAQILAGRRLVVLRGVQTSQLVIHLARPTVVVVERRLQIALCFGEPPQAPSKMPRANKAGVKLASRPSAR